jgi:hypothetical protein
MINSPSWREGGRNLIGLLIVFSVVFAVIVATAFFGFVG